MSARQRKTLNNLVGRHYKQRDRDNGLSGNRCGGTSVSFHGTQQVYFYQSCTSHKQNLQNIMPEDQNIHINHMLKNHKNGMHRVQKSSINIFSKTTKNMANLLLLLLYNHHDCHISIFRFMDMCFDS